MLQRRSAASAHAAHAAALHLCIEVRLREVRISVSAFWMLRCILTLDGLAFVPVSNSQVVDYIETPQAQFKEMLSSKAATHVGGTS